MAVIVVVRMFLGHLEESEMRQQTVLQAVAQSLIKVEDRLEKLADVVARNSH